MLQKGSVLKGKWTNASIEIIRLLGKGANGEVYLASSNRQWYAMKICPSAGDLALEWGILEKLGVRNEYFPKPVLIDDCESQPLYFYLMGWIDGLSLDEVLSRLNPVELHAVLIQILKGLTELHQIGCAFCDVKLQNIMIEQKGYDKNARFVDVGGITPFGRSVRQFTPYSDRAFWGLGTRTSDAHYDLCALVLMLICHFSDVPKNLADLSEKQKSQWLLHALKAPSLFAYQTIFQSVLDGKVVKAKDFLQMVESVPDTQWVQKAKRGKKVQGTAANHGLGVSRRTGLNQGTGVNQRTGSNQGTGLHRGAGGLQPTKIDWTERVMWASLCFAAFCAAAAWASFFGWF